MARADEPRISVRMSRLEFVRLQAAADAADVAVGALARECLVRFAPETARAVSAEGVRLRRRASRVPVRAVPALPWSP